MSDINSAFTVDVGLSLEDVVGVFYGVSDPSSGGGNVAPKGSIYLQVPASGEAQLWKKYAAADTAWKPLQTKTYPTSSSPGVTNDDADTAALGRTFDIGDAWVNTATDTVYVCVDNTTGAAIWQNQTSGSIVRKFFNGTFAETFDARVTAAGAVITMSLEQSGTGNLTMQFSTGDVVLDCTPACTIALTAGSVAVPQANYVYIPIATKVLTLSTTQWPATEHIKIGYFFCQTAAYVAADGPLINQNWNDHLMDTVNQGHVTHIGRWIRNQPARYFSGIGGNGVDGYTTSTAGVVRVKTLSGVVSQLHPHTFAAKDTSGADDVHVINGHATDGGAYFETKNLYDITVGTQGATLTNKYFNIVLAGAANKSGEYDPLLVLIPNGSYNNLSDATNDVSGYDVLDLPRQFTLDSGTGFLICRLTFRSTGGTWVHQATKDLRGTFPSSVSGGSPAGAPIVNFNDASFTWFNNVDATRVVDVDLSAISPSTVRTLTIPDSDVTLMSATLFDANTILAATTDNIPAAVTVAEQTLVGRITGGNIDDLSTTQVRTLLNVEDGAVSANINIATYATSQLLTAAESKGYVIYVTGAGTISLPAIATGMSVTIVTIGAIAVSVDPNASDKIWLDGVALDDGDKITNTSTAGDIAVLTYYSADGWHASTNGWTDGGA